MRSGRSVDPPRAGGRRESSSRPLHGHPSERPTAAVLSSAAGQAGRSTATPPPIHDRPGGSLATMAKRRTRQLDPPRPTGTTAAPRAELAPFGPAHVARSDLAHRGRGSACSRARSRRSSHPNAQPRRRVARTRERSRRQMHAESTGPRSGSIAAPREPGIRVRQSRRPAHRHHRWVVDRPAAGHLGRRRGDRRGSVLTDDLELNPVSARNQDAGPRSRTCAWRRAAGGAACRASGRTACPRRARRGGRPGRSGRSGRAR